jgi:hypothetical protein
MNMNGLVGAITLRVPVRYRERDGHAKAKEPVEPE